MQRGRREVPALVALAATAWLMVQGVVGAATSGNTLRASHLTLDQYSPLPPYHHGFELYGRRSNDGNSQPEDEHQVNRKVDDDSVAGYRRRDSSSIASISANDLPIARKSYEVNVVGSNPRESSRRVVPSETMVRSEWRSKNFAGSKEFGKEGVDYAAAPPSEMDEPFVADETFQDEGPGSVEIYKLDLFEEKKVLPASGAASVKVPVTLGTLPVVPVTTRTSTNNNNNNNNNSNKSKVPKKSSRLAWKLGKSTSGVIKSTTSDATRTTRIMLTTVKDDAKDDGMNLLYGPSSFLESESRSEAPPNGDAFGVGGVPELQVGCEGLEASSYYSRKLRRSVVETKNGRSENDSTTELDIVPISLNLDYDWTDGSDEEMDELLKLKKLESEASKRKKNRGDIDPVLDDFFNQENDGKEKLPIRGDLGSANARDESVKRLGEGLKRGRRSIGESFSSDSSGYGSRKLLWTEDSEGDSKLWGYGENEGILSSDGLDSDERGKHQERDDRDRRVTGRGGNEHGRNVAKAEIDMIREEYERLLEQQRRMEEERLRRLKELDTRRSHEGRIGLEELRKREEARRREKEPEELRRRNPDDSGRNLTPEDRRSYEARRREWMMKRRQEEERQRLEEERRTKLQEERRRQEAAQNAPSNLLRSGYPYDRRNESRTEVEERERMRLERERKLREDMERERHMNRQRYGNDDSERRRMEDERRRYRPEEERSRNNVTREEEYRRRMEEERRTMVERRREEERRREDERRREEERQRADERRREEERQRADERRREEERRRLEQHTPRYPNNITRDRTNEDYQRRLEEHRRKVEEDQRRREEERKLQEYVRRNQPIDPRVNERGEEWNASRRREEEEKEQRRAIEAVRQLNRSRYPALPSERRQHGPSASTYIDPRVSLDESRRRQEMEASLQRRRQEEEMKKRRQEEERRREEEYRRQRSRAYEEERKRMEARRREEERRRQYTIEEERRRSSAVAPSTRSRQDSWPGTRQNPHDRGSQRGRENTASLVPSNLRREGRRQGMERERIRQEEERRRQQALARDNERRRYETSTRPKTPREREEYMRKIEEQRKRQEEARLNALPVSARIIVGGEGSPTHPRPSFSSRAGFGNEIDFPRLNPHNNGLQVSKFPSPATKQMLIQSPVPCVWAVVQCCPSNTNRLVTCFESLGCPGVNWDTNPCRGTVVDAARDEVMKFYAASEEENRY